MNTNNTITIILVDETGAKKNYSADKDHLIKYFSYFKSLFENNFKDSQCDTVEIIVDNIDIAAYVLSSGHHVEVCGVNIRPFHYEPYNVRPFWMNMLLEHQCRLFLGLDSTIMENLVIPCGEFDEFLKMVEKVECSESILKIIAKNIPNDYDINLLSIELLESIIPYLNQTNFLVNTKGTFSYALLDHNMSIIKKIEVMNLQYTNTCSAYNQLKFFIFGGNSFVVHDSVTGKLVKTIYFHEKIQWDYNVDNKMIYLPDREQIVFGIANGICLINTVSDQIDECIYFLDVTESTIIHIDNADMAHMIIKKNHNIDSCRTICAAGKNRVIIHFKSQYHLYDLETREFIYFPITNSMSVHSKIAITRSRDKIAYSITGQHIDICNLNTQEKIIRIRYQKTIKKIEFTLDEKYLITCGNFIQIWDCITGDLVSTIKENIGLMSLYHTDDFDFLPNGNMVLCNNYCNYPMNFGYTEIWDLENRKKIFQINNINISDTMNSKLSDYCIKNIYCVAGPQYQLAKRIRENIKDSLEEES